MNDVRPGWNDPLRYSTLRKGEFFLADDFLAQSAQGYSRLQSNVVAFGITCNKGIQDGVTGSCSPEPASHSPASPAPSPYR